MIGGGGGQLSVDATDDGTVAGNNGLGNHFRGAGTGGGGGGIANCGGGGIANCGGAGGGCIASWGGFGTVRGVLKASGSN